MIKTQSTVVKHKRKCKALWLTCLVGLSVGSSSTADNMRSTKPWDDIGGLQHTDMQTHQGTLNRAGLDALIASGRELFSTSFTEHDGVGRPMATQAIIPTKRKRPPRTEFARTAGMDANACSSCHNQPITGGAGDFSVNVFVSEGFQLADFDSTDPQFSNERNTNHLFGSGLVELLAREMTQSLHTQRSALLQSARAQKQSISAIIEAKGVSFGKLTAHPDGRIDTRDLEGIDADLIIKPFSQKGIMTSLRQFTVNALNHHHGMQAVERFGSRWTGTEDHDEDGISGEITTGDVSALVAYQASLKIPVVRTPSTEWQQAADRGGKLFDQLNCNSCHVRSLPLDSLTFYDPGPYDAAGTLRQNESAGDKAYNLALLEWADQLERNDKGQWMVPLFGNLKRYVIADKQVAHLGNELLSQRFVERNEFMTAELWGVGSTAPYGHRGDLTTLAAIIEAHGGEARVSRDQYIKLTDNQRSDINAFLKSLIIEP